MTVSTPQNRAQYIASGTVKDFDFSFPYQDPTEIHVFTLVGQLRSELGGNQFSVSNPGGGVGGRVTLAVLPAADTVISVVRIPDFQQDIDLLENAEFYLQTIEDGLDERVFETLRLKDLLDRALVLPDAEVDGSGAYIANGNRISGMGRAVNTYDGVPLIQVQEIVAAGGGSGGGGPSSTWPTTPMPDVHLDQIAASTQINDLLTPITTNQQTLAAQVLSLNSNVANVSTSVGNLETRMVDVEAEIDTLSQIAGDANNIITLIDNEEAARIAGDTAIVATVSKIGAADPDGVSFLMNLATVKVAPGETIGTRFNTINVRLGTSEAAIATEQTSRATADSAISQTISKIGALNSLGSAFIFDLNTAMVSPTETLGQRFTGLAAADTSNSAAITAESTTRANADGSLSTQITTLQSTVNGQSTTISQTASTVNGIQAKYTIKIDNNGHISGYGLISDGNTATPVSKFIVLADRFEVWNGASSVAPFLVTGGVVYMQNIVVQDANIQTLKVTKLIGDAAPSPFAPWAWARAQYNGSSVSFIKQFNFGSVSRSSQGVFVFLFTTPMVNSDYIVELNSNKSGDTTDGNICAINSQSNSGFIVYFRGSGGSLRDPDTINIVVFGST